MSQASKKETKPERKSELKRSESISEDVTDGFVARPRVISRFHYGRHNESHLVEFEGSEKVNGSIFIEGVSGVGVTATVVSAYLIKEMNLPIVATFESPYLPAMCAVHSFRATPMFRIHGDADVCVAVGDLPISASEKSEILWDITRAFADFARRHRCKHIIAVEGMPIKNEFDREISKIEKMIPKNPEAIDLGRDESNTEEQPEEHKDEYAVARYITCDLELAKKLKELGHKPVKTGQIIGLTGSLLSFSYTASSDDPPITVLLAPDPVKIPDQRGALLAVRLLRELFALDLETSSLETEARRLADKIKATISDIRDQIASQVHKSNRPAPANMYL